MANEYVKGEFGSAQILISILLHIARVALGPVVGETSCQKSSLKFAFELGLLKVLKMVQPWDIQSGIEFVL
jgi:hypothetical protein